MRRVSRDGRTGDSAGPKKPDVLEKVAMARDRADGG